LATTAKQLQPPGAGTASIVHSGPAGWSDVAIEVNDLMNWTNSAEE